MRARLHTVLAMVIALVIACAAPPASVAEPFVPTDDALVLERLPVSPLDPQARRLRAMRSDLARRPDDLNLAVQVAWLCIEQGRALADPRHYGYAQAALAPWWDAAAPPAPVLVLRATIRQHDHDFDAALADLALALRADPDNSQAWLTQAVVQQVRGDYDAARQSCFEVLQRATPLVAATCLSGVDALNGAAAPAYERLHHALGRAGDTPAGARRWALTTLAEIAARLGRPAAAEAHFRQALQLDGTDDYLLGAYADFLLDQRRPADVRQLLATARQTDAVLLRLALADAMSGATELAADTQLLRERFAAARLRGDTVHRREEARFALYVLGDAATALALARDNWTVQREPWDARILLESALAAGANDAAQPAVSFLGRSGLEDVVLASAAARLQTERR